MPIIKYTTKIDPWKTVNEVQQILSKHNVTHFSIKNEGSFPVALAFAIDVAGRPLNFLLPCNYSGVLRCLKNNNKVPANLKTEEQALRVAWRIIKEWVEAQLAIIEAEFAPIEEIFLPYLVVNESGETLANKILKNDGLKLLK